MDENTILSKITKAEKDWAKEIGISNKAALEKRETELFNDLCKELSNELEEVLPAIRLADNYFRELDRGRRKGGFHTISLKVKRVKTICDSIKEKLGSFSPYKDFVGIIEKLSESLDNYIAMIIEGSVEGLAIRSAESGENIFKGSVLRPFTEDLRKTRIGFSEAIKARKA